MKISHCHRRGVSARSGFTVIELMVVVAIIGLLIGLLLPGLGMVRATARATKSQSNLRQWGIGTIAWSGMNDERLPWEGMKDAADMPLNFAQRAWWGNAVPPMVGHKAYAEISKTAFDRQENVGFFGDSESIFIDPAARPADASPWGFGEPGAGGLQQQFYFNYVPNSQLNNTLLARSQTPQYSPNQCMRLAMISSASNTILMLEMRSNQNELTPSDVHYSRDLKRQRADWKRFAARHFNGGHMLFADGHVGWVANDEATTNSQGSRDPSFAQGDWNTSKLIWDPLGPATDE